MKELFDSFSVDGLAEGHPWKNFSAEDAQLAAEYFRTLDSDEIAAIVARAQYSKAADAHKMKTFLTLSRDAFLEYLPEHVARAPQLETDSYWASFIPESPLSFEIRDNRSPQIGVDVKKFVDTLEIPEGHLLLFRGQASLTDKVLSPSARQFSKRTPEEVKKDLNGFLYNIKMDMNWHRDKARKNALFGDSAGEVAWWERAKPLDYLAADHASSDGHGYVVAATRDLGVASRWVEGGRFLSQKIKKGDADLAHHSFFLIF